MRCKESREELSAQLDGEQLDGPRARQAGDHLARCSDCRQWLRGAQQLARRTRLSGAPSVPDNTERILAAVLAQRQDRRMIVTVRLALAVVALAQLALTVPVLFLGRDHQAPVHLAHELGSFGLALAAGFLAAASRPQRARGMLPLVAVAALALLITAIHDLAVGRTDLVDELPHLVAVVGCLLLALLARSDGTAPLARLRLPPGRSHPKPDPDRTTSGRTAIPAEPAA